MKCITTNNGCYLEYLTDDALCQASIEQALIDKWKTNYYGEGVSRHRLWQRGLREVILEKLQRNPVAPGTGGAFLEEVCASLKQDGYGRVWIHAQPYNPSHLNTSGNVSCEWWETFNKWEKVDTCIPTPRLIEWYKAHNFKISSVGLRTLMMRTL